MTRIPGPAGGRALRRRIRHVSNHDPQVRCMSSHLVRAESRRWAGGRSAWRRQLEAPGAAGGRRIRAPTHEHHLLSRSAAARAREPLVGPGARRWEHFQEVKLQRLNLLMAGSV